MHDQSRHFIVFIDHLGLISARGRTSYEIATKVAKELRKISLDNNCTIIALCQLNRDSAKENKPSLSMLRDSGEIEQSARKVMFVWEENENYSICIEKMTAEEIDQYQLIIIRRHKNLKRGRQEKMYEVNDSANRWEVYKVLKLEYQKKHEKEEVVEGIVEFALQWLSQEEKNKIISALKH